MFEWAINTYASNELVKFFFWGPMVFNAIVYPIHVWVRLKQDRIAVAKWRAEYAEIESRNLSSYRPSPPGYNFITIGSLFKYFFLTVLPVLNALAAIFHAGPIALDYLTERFEWLFSIKLVNPSKG